MNQQTEVKISGFEIAKSEREIKRTKPQLDNKVEKPDQNNRVAKFEMSKYKLSKFEIAKSEFTNSAESNSAESNSAESNSVGSYSDGSNLEGLHLQTLSKAPCPEVTNSERLRLQSLTKASTSEVTNIEKRCLEGFTEVSNSQAANSQSALSQSSDSEVASSEAANSEMLRQQSRIETTNSKASSSETLPQQSPTEASNSALLNPEIFRLQNLHSQVLIANVKSLAQKEKALTMQIIDYLSEIARRRAYLPKYTSLFTFLVEELGYCPSTAMLRINAIKAFEAVPEIRKKVLDNKMSLNAVSKTQSFINQQMREDQNKDKAPLTKEEQRELFAAIENTPASQIEDTLHERKQELDARKAEAKGEPPPPREVRTQKVTLEVDGDLQKMVEELKSLLSHTHPGASLSMLLKQVLPSAIEKLKRDRGLVKVKRRATGLSSMESEKNWEVPSLSMELVTSTAAPSSLVKLDGRTAAPSSLVKLVASTAAPGSSIELGECTEASSSSMELEGSTTAPSSSIELGERAAAPRSSMALGGRAAAPSSLVELGGSAATPRSLMKLGVRKSEEGPARTQKKVQSQAKAQAQAQAQAQKATDGIRNQGKIVKRAIPASIKQVVWSRDRGCCQYRDPNSQKTCGSRYQVQFDHIKPWSIGGEHSSENLRLLCGVHNRHRSRSFDF